MLEGPNIDVYKNILQISESINLIASGGISSLTDINNLKKINIKYLLLFSLFLMLIQIFIGTGVREFIDEQIKIYGRENKDLWLSSPKLNFYIHRTFSILVFS